MGKDLRTLIITEPAYGDTPSYEVEVKVDGGAEEVAARTAMAYMTAFNQADPAGCNAVINFPHVRLAGEGGPRISATPDEMTTDRTFEWLRGKAEWDHSCWDHMRVVHASDRKVHLDVQFTRYRADGSVIGHYPSLWVITCQEGHWGIQIRSSYAG